ncbi:MAG: Crp/Fnr family transcriptional regulator [Thiohalomonadales bacterium]
MLQNVPLFSNLTSAEQDAIKGVMLKKTFVKNVIIAHEGGQQDSFYVILSGSVKEYISDRTGKEITLAVLKPYDYFGELSLLGDACQMVSIMTLEKACLAVIQKRELRQLLSQYPGISNCLLKDLACKVEHLTDKVRNFALCDVYGRLVKILQSMASHKNGCLQIEEKITQRELAGHIGASQKMVARILKDLCKGGYITYQNKMLSIHKKLPENY